jgi:hypothetical protein
MMKLPRLGTQYGRQYWELCNASVHLSKTFLQPMLKPALFSVVVISPVNKWTT